jgi:predicted phosphodiesterase
LLAKKATYIYGNHDKIDDSDESQAFSVNQEQEVELRYGKRLFIITHGHKYDLSFHHWVKSGLGQFLAHNKPFLHFIMFVEEVLMRVWDRSISKKRLQKFNEEIKQQMSKKFASHIWIVCGHTHSAELDLDKQFVNSGVIRGGVGQYLTINKVGFIELHEERY